MKISSVKGWPIGLLLLLLVGCQKEGSNEDDGSQYFIKCKIGGVDKTFNISASATKEDLGSGTTSYSMFGKAITDPSNLESIGFTIQMYIPLVTGTYKETDPTTDYFLAGIYNPNTTDPTKIFASQYNETDPFQITFSTITATELSGSFKGKLFLNTSDPSPDSTIVSDGQFKVRIKQL